MRLKAAITGNLIAFMEKQKAAAETAVTAGISEVTQSLKLELRTQVINAGLGNKLAHSWQSQVYPRGKKSIEAAGWIYSKASHLIRAFDEGVFIQSRRGLFLAIPTEMAPKRGVDGKRISPSNFPEHTLGRLRFVYQRRGPSLLVADRLQVRRGKKGLKARKSSASSLRTERGLSTVIMFFLVRHVSLKKRLDYKQVVQTHKQQLPQAILKHWPKVSSIS